MTPETLQFEPSAELWSLTAAMCDGAIAPDELDRLETILRADEAARLFYAAYMDLHGRMSCRFRGHRVEESRSRLPDGTSRSRLPSGTEFLPSGTEFKAEGGRRKAEETYLPSPFGRGAVEKLPSPFGRGAGGEGSVTAIGNIGPVVAAPYSVLRTPYSPFSSFLPTTPLGNVAFSYAMSAVLVAIGLFIFSLMSASSPRDAIVGHNPANSQNHVQPNSPAPEPEMVSVARITGMVDCVWVNADDAPFHNKIKLHDKFALTSGLLEITYHTGAKVILQGPCTYEVEATAGGYLSLGKLTARVETAKSQAAKRSSPFPLPPSPLFAIRTPTAVVTDLGTEFGVEVRPGRQEDVVVLQGQVRVTVFGVQGAAGQMKTLQAGQSAQIDCKAATLRVGQTLPDGVKPFVRVLPNAKTLPAEVAARANLVLWLKGDAIQGLNDGSSLGMWSDSSGGRNHMHHATWQLPVYISGASSGLNHKPVVRFKGREHLSGCLDVDSLKPGIQPLKSPFTLFSVVKNSDNGEEAVNRGYFGGGEACMAFGMGRVTFEPRRSFWAWTPTCMNTYGQADSLNDQWNIHVYTLSDLNPRHWTWHCNGRAMGGAGLDSGTALEYANNVYLGASGWLDENWVGDVAELMIYDGVLNESELKQVGGYLAKKYAIDTAWPDTNQSKSGSTRSDKITPREKLPMEQH